MLEKEMKTCLESLDLPGHHTIENVHCHPGQCIGYSRWGMRESHYEIPGMGHVHDPTIRYNPMARRTDVAPWHVINDAKELLREHATKVCNLGKGIHADVEDDVHFRRLQFKLYVR